MRLDSRKAVVLSLLACAAVLLVPVDAQASGPAAVWQSFPIRALQNGYFYSTGKVSDLLAHGHEGVGAMANLDGEVIVIDDKVYQFRTDGNVRLVGPTEELSFAALSNFSTTPLTKPIPPGTQFHCLADAIDPELPSLNTFYAVRIRGTFSSVKGRTFPGQHEPYPPLCRVPVVAFPEFTNIKGTMVGFRAPAYLNNVAIPEYHLHFLSDDKTKGGHVLDFTVSDATIQLSRLDRLEQDAPTNPAYARMDLSELNTCGAPPPPPPPPCPEPPAYGKR